MTYSKKSLDQQHEKTILSNGLTVLSLKNDNVSSVAIEIWVKVGSRNESINLNGIAHFIEHMNFKGTSKRSAKEIAEEFDAIGGYLNAYTSKENTVYSAKILREFFPLAVDVLSDIMFNSVYSEEEIEKEKNVVLQELAQVEDTPEEMVFENFSELAFANQAVGRSILGTKENILKFTRQQLIEFTRAHYIAPKIIISASGNLTHQELLDLVSEKFIPFPGRSIIEEEKSVYTGGHKFKHDSKLSQFHLVVGYEGLSIHSDEYYKLEMLANIWGGSISSRLFQEIREKRGLVYSVGSFCHYFSDSGVFGALLSTSNDKIDESLKVLSEEIIKLTHTITQEEIDRCLAQVKASLCMSRETIDNWVSIMAGNYSCHGRYIAEEEIWQGYTSITIEQLHDLAKRIFSSKKLSTISVLGNTENFPDYQHIQKLVTI